MYLNARRGSRHSLAPAVSRAAVLTVLLACLACPPAAAQSADPRYDPAWHGGIAAAALLASGAMLLAERDEVPDCRSCGVGLDGTPRVPRIDGWARSHWRWADQHRADTLSHVTASAAFAWPLVGLSAVHGGTGGEWGRDQIASLGSIAVAQFAADLSKRVFRRARPGVVFDGDPIRDGDDVHAFFSGHAATTFAAVVSTGAIASRRDSNEATWIWIAGLGFATTTSYLRVAADRHFLTDVLAGAAVGAAVGMLMPHVFDEGQASPGAGQPVAMTIAGIGPAARLGPRNAVATIQIGAGPGRLGIVGTVDLR